jgi:thiosulfate reductase cytochrome b subunit
MLRRAGNRQRILRHGLVVRITHWVNAICLIGLLMSGLQIFNAHSSLYWGQYSDFTHPILQISTRYDDSGEPSKGITTIFGRSFDTTGLLGLSNGPDAVRLERGFPSWITLPADQDLATGRRWHFFLAWLFVANGAIYFVFGLIDRHFRRDLLPSLEQMRDIGRTLVDHFRLRFPSGDAARQYNVLQKLSYLFVIFVVLPLIVVTGLTMSPGLDAAMPELVPLLGGRQSARTIHFVAATGITLFAVIHVIMVLISGAWNNLRSMITGRYDIPEARKV